MRAIRAFDALGKRRFVHWRRSRYGLPVRALDESAWRAAVERILIDVLAERGDEAGDRESTTPRRPELGARS
jgi:hypothetical protein